MRGAWALLLTLARAPWSTVITSGSGATGSNFQAIVAP